MCTSLTLETKDGHHLLARTMDFAQDFNQEIIITPRRYKWKNITNETIAARQAVVGLGVNLQDKAMLADGVNEAGLTCATLYLAGFAAYNKTLEDNKTNLAPYDFVLWSLTQFDSVQSVKEAINEISFFDAPMPLLELTPPLHWILSDKSGECIVIEPTVEGVKLYDNPVGVMTNSPEFDWHLQNLRQYMGLRPQQLEPAQWGSLELSAFGQGAGTMGLPGDYTPPSRFVRAAYLRQHITNIESEIDGVTAAFHILSNCNVPKGAVINSEGAENYTIYTSTMCMETGTYYYHTYDCHQISAVHLFNENLDTDQIKTYPFHRAQKINNEN
ncbi:choloylglycine hydrolase [Scopulibacillus daqui]|uniref:choloylglycine hydrolase n=1 Tax=Scopulibacillus daqui TaxID=1469162 RepID=A0ABS2PXT0_9BACL|nr:choloylglycine hydrolase [Scopulibacillus daqui]MBM7644515.1 choloylglycine hydrolase [Scopulibacillus daqui]